jgi:integrase
MPEQEARQPLAEFEAREIKRHYLGDEKALTFAEAVFLYPTSDKEATYLTKVLPEIGERAIAGITPQEVRNLGQKLYPEASTDTWQRQVVTPVRAVINNAHDLGKCPPIRVKAFSKAERLKQDKARGKTSRIEKVPGSWEWLEAFRAHANPYLKSLALFMFETGCRVTQAISLKPADLDLQNARVWMPEAKGTEAQWVTISMEMVVELANLHPRRPRKGPHGETRPKGHRVFGYANRNGVYGAWRTACKEAGIEIILPHAAGRHGFGTEMLVRQRLDPATVARAGRWADMALMLRTYIHPEDPTSKVQEALRAGREKVAGYMPSRTNPVRTAAKGRRK